ncbi:DNA polymerase epsilon subunit B-like [Vicia villosa]|uniref:DNA polymerase epsilon subunit B-like n=1 Tax=Vicia villosa TaxID=3911 RepID=UPI00273BFF45|nr:DNA polymerase epsilon subunit B-like [Vicia villosa]
MNAPTKKKIEKKCKIRGYNIKLEALDEILSFVTRFELTEQDEATDLVLDQLEHESIKSTVIDVEPVQRVVNLLLEADEAGETFETFASSSSSAIVIIDVFDVPRYKYDAIRRNFYQYPGSLSLHGDAAAKSALYRDRFLLLSQRLSRHQDFSKPAFESELSQFRSREISPIQSLVGQKGRRWVMGVISQLEDGHFYLEDLTASVKISLSDAKITTGFFLENTIVVAEGEMISAEGIFQIYSCGFPPPEDRDKSLQVLAGHDFFGGGTFTKEETIRQEEMEKRAVNDMFVILSDIFVDKEESMGKLEIVLDGFESEEVVPSLFVFMGDFCSVPYSQASGPFSILRLQFGRLGKIIAARPRLKENSRFLFIPGPGDIGPSTVLPRCRLPKCLTEELQKYIPDAIFSSNPCRVKFYTQEIVFFRQDQLYRMSRSSLVPPSVTETTDPFQHFVATITHQSHLCPLPLTKQPIIWNYDHGLDLYPTPHTIVLGERSPQKAFKYTGTTCFNTGSFSMDSTFVVYRPCSQEVELSSL